MTIRDADYKAFVDFETNAWVKLSEHYDTLAGQMTRQARVALRSGDRFLDVATGPGYVAAEARRRGAVPLGVDFSTDMIALARRQFPELSVEQGDAENLRFADESFDTVVCAFGMLHFPRPGRALAEAHRVLRRGRRHAYTVWCPPARNDFFRMIGDIMIRHADPSIRFPEAPSQYMLGDPMVSAALMDAAGFVDVNVEVIPCHFTARAPDDVLGFMRKCAPRAIYIYGRLAPDVQARIRQDLLDAGARAVAEHGGLISCPIILASGTKAS